MARLSFDVLAKDNASGTLAKVGRAFKQVGDDADKASGKIGGEYAASAKKLETLSRALTNARRDEENAAGRLRVAEARLNDLRTTGKVKAAQLLAAEEQVAKARRDVTVSSDRAAVALRKFARAQEESGDAGERSGEKLSKGFGSSLKRWFTGDGQGLFKQIGNDGGTVFGSGFLGALKTPILGPAIAGVLTAAVLTALPAVGGIAAGALVTGFGAGLAALGIVFAAQSQKVGHVWSQTLSNMGEDMRLISRPFESTLVSVAAYMKRTFDSFTPYLQSAFAKMAGPVADFADQVGEAFQQLGPTIQPVTDAFNNVLRSLGPATREAFGSIAQGIKEVADSIGENPEALADTVRGIGDFTRNSLTLLSTLNDLNAQIDDLTGGVSAADAVMGTLSAPIAMLNSSMSSMHAGLEILNGDWGSAAKGSGEAVLPIKQIGPMLDAGAAAAMRHAAATRAGTTATTAASAAQSVWIAPTKEATAALQAQNTWLNNVVSSMQRLANLALGLSGAQISYQAAIDGVTQSLKDNGKTLNINTEKGRANRTALNAVAQAANSQTAAMIQSGKGVAAAAVSADHSRSKFVSLAMQFGLSKKAAQTMAAQLIAIPNVTRTAKLQAEKRDLDAKLARAKAQLNDKNLTRERRAKLNADIAALQAKIRQAQAEINGLRGKTVTVRVMTVGGVKQDQSIGGGGHTPTDSRAHGGLLPGTPSNRDNMVINAASGEFVVNAKQTRKHLGLLRALNAGVKGFATGGLVTRAESGGVPPPGLYSPSQAAALKQVQNALLNSLRAMTKAVQTSAEKITSLLGKYHELEQQASSSFQGGLFGGDNAGGALGLMGRLRGQENDANTFRKALTTLKAKKLNTGLFEQLAASGDVMSAIQLAQMGAGGIAQLNKQYANSQRAAAAVGTFSAQTVYGGSIRAEQARMRERKQDREDLKQALREATVVVNFTASGSAESLMLQLLQKSARTRATSVQRLVGMTR